MAAYYNEVDKNAAQWLRNLILLGHIAEGDVDERSIEDVSPYELIGYDQCHFFAGIGVWSHALRRAGWSDDRPVWTGSCPCQPFSAAGKRGGTADERHLWPAWEWLIRHAKPRGVPVFGEQVASKDGLAWLDLVHADLEGQGHTVRALDLCAAGVGAPHIRQRLFFVADTDSRERGRGAIAAERNERHRQDAGRPQSDRSASRSGATGIVADTDGRNASAEGLQRGGEHGQQPEDGSAGGVEHAASDGRFERWTESGRWGVISRCSENVVGDADDAGPQGRGVPGATAGRDGAGECAAGAAGATNGFWRDADWLPCIDGKARPVEPGTFPLAHGAPARVGRLRAYGNAIVAPLAEDFIRAYLEQSALSELL